MPITTSPKVSPFCLLMGLAVCTTNAYCAGTICSAFHSKLGSAIQHSLNRCTSIGCVHHKGVLCWHNLQLNSTAHLVQPVSTHTREVCFHRSFSHCFGVQLVTCTSAKHQVISKWCQKLVDVKLALLHALAHVLQEHSFTLVFVKSQGKKRGTLTSGQYGTCPPQVCCHAMSVLLSCHISVAVHATSVLLSCHIRPLYEITEVSHQELIIVGSDKAQMLIVLWRTC